LHTTSDDPNELHVVNYVPDEISVIVSASDIDDEASFYEHVRSQLNRQLAALLKLSNPDVKDDFEADLAPTILTGRFANDRAVLQPLRRSRGRRAQSDGYEGRDEEPPDLTPWTVFRRHASGASTRHMYFRLGREPRLPIGRLDLERQRIGLQSVRELTLLLNRFVLSKRQEPFRNQAWSIKAVAPNWLTVAFQNPCGCPAGLPVAIDRKRYPWHFRFRGALARALQAPVKGEVVVAVLDTCPRQIAVDEAAARWSGNSLLAAVQQNVRMNSPALIPTPALGQLDGCLPRLQWDMQSGPVHDHPDQFTLADHGLFVTGIVYDVLQDGGRVHLIRVLNDHGVGDLFAITHALAQLPRLLLGSDEPRPGEPRLVVNLSLGIDLPIPARLLDRWLPRTAQNPDVLRRRLPDVSAMLDLVHANLTDAIASLVERGVVVVAATGNDALRRDVPPGDRPPPRFPARYDNVLGVASMRRDLQTAANYSNRGELTAASWPGDVSTFGGNIVSPGADDEPGLTDAEDGIVGIFSTRPLPGGADNTSGWVRWAGTSFSTPIVGAVAARLWATDPTRGPLDVIAWVGSFAHPPNTGPDPDGPLGVPVIDVSQP
jgi:hypothetical protein